MGTRSRDRGHRSSAAAHQRDPAARPDDLRRSPAKPAGRPIRAALEEYAGRLRPGRSRGPSGQVPGRVDPGSGPPPGRPAPPSGARAGRIRSDGTRGGSSVAAVAGARLRRQRARVLRLTQAGAEGHSTGPTRYPGDGSDDPPCWTCWAIGQCTRGRVARCRWCRAASQERPPQGFAESSKVPADKAIA